MSNPIFDAMQPNVVQQFQRFQQMFKGDPRQQVQEMLRSGRISQAQYNAAVQKAQQIQRLLGR